jgi:hypothetical protein
MSSALREINEYLESTRMMSRTELNAIIRDLDPEAAELQTQGFAHSVLGYMMVDKIAGLTPNFRVGVTKAGSLKERHPWLFAEPVAQAIVDGDEPEAVEVKKVKVTKPKLETKSDIAKRIYAGLTDKSKVNVIKVFMQELGTSAAGAQTYFYASGGEKSGKAPKATKIASVIISSTVSLARATKVGPTKKQLATEIYTKSVDKSRDTIVQKFMVELSMTKLGASTYFYNVGGARTKGKTKQSII